MSFTNDDERDGLASLFGGITPQPAPEGELSPRRAARRAAEQAALASASSGAAAEASAEQAAPPAFPPSASGEQPAYAAPPVAPPPSYAPPPSFGIPPTAPEPPTFAGAAEPPAFPAPAYTPPSYAAPVEPTAPEPTGAFGEPVAPPAWSAPAPEPQPYVPPAYVPPVVPAAPEPGSFLPDPLPPVQEAPVQGFPHPSVPVPPAPVPPTPVEARPVEPALVEPAARAETAAPQYPGLAPEYPGLAPAPTAYPPAYPPTAQYPTGAPAASYDPPVPQDAVPASEPPAPTEPPALTEPPAFNGFAALGLDPVADVEAPEAPPSEAAPRSDEWRDAPTVAAETRSAAAGAEAPSAVVAASRPDRGSAPVLRRPPGPLLPVEHPVLESSADLARATTLEKVGLGVAVVGGPIGLGLAIVNAIRGVRRRGWLTGIGKWSLALGVLSTIGAVIGGVALYDLRQAQLHHDELAAASSEFCAAAAENPEIVEPPYLGWPAPGATITESLELMQAWTTRWTELAPLSPEQLRPGLETLAERGGEVIAAVEQTRLVNDAENKRLIGAIAQSSGVAVWHETYCVER